MDEIKNEDIEMTPVVSSNISAIGFKGDTLRVTFTNGATYETSGASQADYDSFLASKSKGIHFNKNLKRAFEFKKIEKKGDL